MKGCTEMQLGTKLKTLRKNANLSQIRVAKELGISRQAISHWENNRNYPDIEKIRDLSILYHVDPKELLSFTNEGNDVIKQSNNMSYRKTEVLLLLTCVLFILAPLSIFAIPVIMKINKVSCANNPLVFIMCLLSSLYNLFILIVILLNVLNVGFAVVKWSFNKNPVFF